MSADFAVSEPTIVSNSFRNVRLAMYWGAIAAGSILVFILRRHAAIGLASAAVAAFATQAALASWAGVVVRHDHVAVPRPLLPVIPILSFWRMRIPLVYLRDATALGQFMGLEAVGLGTVDGATPILLANRQQKLDFFQALQAEKADVKIYRTF